jgi:hypothetical protein
LTSAQVVSQRICLGAGILNGTIVAGAGVSRRAQQLQETNDPANPVSTWFVNLAIPEPLEMRKSQWN